MGSSRKSVSDSFTVIAVEDGQSAPYYFQEWFAWSNDASTANVTTAPVIGGTWQTSIPAQGAYTYLWRKSIRHVWNDVSRTYTAETAQYFRMSGTDGTSIHTKGSVDYEESTQGSGTALDLITNPSDGDAYVVGLDTLGNQGWLYQWTMESNSWIPLGQFKGEAGKTYYTHIAWATNVTYSGATVTAVTGFVTVKSPNDTTHLWMGVLVDENSGQDPSNAKLYTWSYTKGADGTSPVFADLNNEMDSVACDADGKVTAEQSVGTFVSLWRGSTRLSLTSITCYIDGVTIGTSYAQSGIGYYYKCAKDTGTGQVTLTVRQNAVIESRKNVDIYVAGSGVSGSLVVTLTVNGIRPGAKGQDAVIYRLVPSVSEIVRRKDGTTTPSGNVTCAVTRTVGNGTPTVAPSTEYTLKRRIDGGEEKTYSGTPAANVTSGLEFILYVPKSGSTVADRETVPVVMDGADGEDGLTPRPNILLRTVFDRGIDKVKEGWSANWAYVAVDTDTARMVEGRKSLRVSGQQSSYTNLTQNVFARVRPGTWYTLSFHYFAAVAVQTFIFSGSSQYGCVDTAAGCYVDGVFNEYMAQDGSHTWSAQQGDGARHSFAFRTKSTFDTGTAVNVMFRVPAGAAMSLCMPKVEEGMVATPYMAHEDDLVGDSVVGPRGKTGRFFYYAGAWADFAATDTFMVTDAQAPYFLYGGTASNPQYWVWTGDNPASGNTYTKAQMGTPSDESSNWRLMTTDFKYLITEAIFGRYAHFGSAIINGDWLISTIGRRGNVQSEDYWEFDPQYPSKNNSSATNFIPNFSIDMRSGSLRTNNMYFPSLFVNSATVLENTHRLVHSSQGVTYWCPTIETIEGGVNLSYTGGFTYLDGDSYKLVYIVLPCSEINGYAWRGEWSTPQETLESLEGKQLRITGYSGLGGGTYVSFQVHNIFGFMGAGNSAAQLGWITINLGESILLELRYLGTVRGYQWCCLTRQQLPQLEGAINS